MLSTTDTMYLGGEYKSFRLPYEQIVRRGPFIDSLEMSRDATGTQCEVFTVLNAWPACGWFLFNLAHFLAQPDARALYGKGSKSAFFSESPSEGTNPVSPSNQARKWDVFISHASEDKDE